MHGKPFVANNGGDTRSNSKGRPQSPPATSAADTSEAIAVMQPEPAYVNHIQQVWLEADGKADLERKSVVRLLIGDQFVEKWEADQKAKEEQSIHGKTGGAPTDVRLTRKSSHARKLQKRIETAKEVVVAAEVAARDANEKLLSLMAKKDAVDKEVADIQAQVL